MHITSNSSTPVTGPFVNLVIDAREDCRERFLEDQQEVLLCFLVVHVRTELFIEAIHGIVVEILDTAVHHELEKVGYEFAVSPQV